jgi:hypothetical protein
MANKDDEIDLGETFRAMKEHSQQKRARNRESSAAVLTRNGLQFESKNNGSHLIVTMPDGSKVDFWPGTGLWHTRGTPQVKDRGVYHLVKYSGINNEHG